MPFAVTLSGSSLDTVTVAWATAAGTAVSPKDFTAASGTVTFAPGETAKTITVQIVGETTKEKDETMGVRLSNPVNALLGDSSGLGTILDDDATPRFSATMVSSAPAPSNTTTATTSSSTTMSMTSLETTSLSSPTTTLSSPSTTTTTATTTTPGSLVEGNTGNRTLVTFMVVPTNATDVPMSVDFATVAGSSARENIDYIAKAGTLLFAPETADPQFVTVEVVGNLRHQPTHKFFIRLANPVAAVVDGLDAEADIVDDDPVPTLSVSDVTLTQLATGTVNAVVNVTLSNDTDDIVSVNYRTTDVTAFAGKDYLGQTGTLTFPPGTTSQAITITVNSAASITETVETFYVEATGGANATIGKARGVVTILPPVPTAWVSSTMADFSTGAVAGTYVSETGDGEVTLAPAIGSEFRGKTLDAGWTGTSLVTGGAGTLGGGLVTLDGASIVGGAATVTPGHSLEFVGKFTGAAGQNAGFMVNGGLSQMPYAVFGTKASGTLLARSVMALKTIETPIAGFTFNQPHKFRIDWTSSSVVYWIDDVKVVTHTIAVTQNMRPGANDLTVGDGALVLDYMRMTPYSATGTFTSAVFDAGAPVTFTTLTWSAITPVGTTVAVQYRTGNTPTPDATWTAGAPVSALDGIITGTARYIQFVVKETSTDKNTTPVLKDVTVAFKP
jgi:hypothetical protein